MASREFYKQMVIARAKYLGKPIPKRITKAYRAKVHAEFQQEFKKTRIPFMHDTETFPLRLSDIRKGKIYSRFPLETLPISRQGYKIQYRYIGDVIITVAPKGVFIMDSRTPISGTYEPTLRKARNAYYRSVERIAQKASVQKIELAEDINNYLVYRFVEG